jgi:hypothetical protein
VTAPGTAAASPVTPAASRPPVTFRNSSITIPTPWATDPPVAEKPSAVPGLAAGAVVLGSVLIVIGVIIRKREDGL